MTLCLHKTKPEHTAQYMGIKDSPAKILQDLNGCRQAIRLIKNK